MSYCRVSPFHGGNTGSNPVGDAKILDATDDPTHGEQQLSFFNGHYHHTCYLPLLAFVSFNEEKEQFLLAAVLQPGNAAPAGAGLGVVRRVIERVGRYFPKKKEEKYGSFLQACQKKLDQHVKEIRLSARLVGSPSCLVTEEHEFSPHLERLPQKGKGGGPKQRRIMELNPDHPIFSRLYDRFTSNADDPFVGDSVELLFELALVAEGSEIADPVRLNQLILELLQKLV